MFLHVSVILFTGGRGLTQCMLGYTLPSGTTGRHPPGTRGRHPPQDQRQGTPLSRHPPRTRHPPGSRHPLEPGTPPGPEAGTSPGSRHTPWNQAPPRSRHPPEPGTPKHSACWKIWATSGLYASYWNAIFLCFYVSMSSVPLVHSLKSILH